MKTLPGTVVKAVASTSGKKDAIRVLIVDDHPLLRKGVGQLIDQEADLVVVGEAENAHKAISAIEDTRPDVVLIDISLNGTSGIELLKSVKARFPKLKLLVLSMHEESVYAHRALRAGASGYVMKEEATEKVLTAVRKVSKGDVYLSERMGSQMLHTLADGHTSLGKSPVEELSDRELEVFNLIGLGHGTRVIAGQLQLSVKTIESHRAHIKEKLNLQSAAELVHHATRWVQSECARGGREAAVTADGTP